MRLALGLAALIAATSPVLAQPRGPAAPKRPPQAQPQQPPAPPPGFFPCRTEGEVCYIGVVTGPSQVAILFTSDPQSEGVDPKPLEVSSGDQPGQALDLASSVGRVVMLTGSLDPKTGLTKAQVVDTAGPLLSFAMKAQMSGDEGAGAGPQRGGGKAPPRRR